MTTEETEEFVSSQNRNDLIREIKTTHSNPNGNKYRSRVLNMYQPIPTVDEGHAVDLNSNRIDVMPQTLQGALRVGHSETPHPSFRLGESYRGGDLIDAFKTPSLERPEKDEYIALQNLDTVGYKAHVEECSGIQEPKIPRKKSKSYDDMELAASNECATTVCTCLSLGLMLICLLVPAVFHVCCQFRLYGGFFKIPDKLKDNSSATNRLQDIFQAGGVWHIVDHFGEFENFFFMGVFMYTIVQFCGYNVTRVRFNHYIRALCNFSLDSAKHDFLNANKQYALEHFKSHIKRVCMHSYPAAMGSGDNLVKEFNKNAAKFDSSACDNIWKKVTLYRYKTNFCSLYVPLILHFIISVGMCAFIYDRRFRMHHRVPLAHPELVSNFYWYAALQYEGVWCIGMAFILNMLSWVYLCWINSHDHLYSMLDNTLTQTQLAAQTFANDLSREIWTQQMNIFSETTYANDVDSVVAGKTLKKVPFRWGTISSSINFNPTDEYKHEKRPCLCHCLYKANNPAEYDESNKNSHVNISTPFDDLALPLIEKRITRSFRKRMRSFLKGNL